VIPKIVHFAYFYPSDFPLYGCLAVKSAQKYLTPDKIFLYRAANAPEIRGEWWQSAKGAVEIVKVRPPTHIYGCLLNHPAHQADVFRLQTLIEQGGIYLDLDTICCASFDRLLDQRCVLGHQTKDQSYGLCNAAILAERQSAFLQLWLDGYKSFRSSGLDKYWDEHSVRLPLKLARSLKASDRAAVHIEPHTTFFAAGFQVKELTRLFETCEEFPKSVSHHLWASYSYKKYLARLSPKIMTQVPTTYNLLAGKVMELRDSTAQFRKSVARPHSVAHSFPADFVFDNREYRLIGPDKNCATLSFILREKTFFDLEVLRFIRERRLRGTYVDVGANIGNHSVYFLCETKCERLVSIEADERLILYLQTNVMAREQNSLRYRILNAVISCRDAAYINPAQTIDEAYGLYVSRVCLGEDSFPVKPSSLDNILNGEKRIVLLRVAGEGHLIDVLKSAETLLRNQSPEICLHVTDCVCDEVYQFMAKYDYLPLVTFPGGSVYFVRFPHFSLRVIALAQKLPKIIFSRVVWRFVRLIAILSRGFPLRMFNRLVPWCGPIAPDPTQNI